MNKTIQAWADKLLDTGNRNNLVSYKDRKLSFVEVISQAPHEFFTSLAHGKEFDVFEPRKWFVEHSLNGEPFPKTLNRDEFVEKFLPQVDKDEVLLYNPFDAGSTLIVKKLKQKIDSSFEETGVNVGYVFYGQVAWKDCGTTCYAPLLLLPISFYQETINKPYILRAADDDIVVNPTFNYKIKAEFNVELPDFDEDEDLPTYLQKVGNVVKKLGWTVSDCCKLSLFSFLKINMYKDLLENEPLIVKNPNIRCLLGEDCGDDPDSPITGEVDLGEGFNELVDIHNVVDADSSQLEAIKLAKAGKSFVLQGPPGTGKSQTIANIIAESLYDNKKVLFVSEKQAALNVVYEKLKNVGLSEFCLELHSHKIKKKNFVTELAKTLRMSGSMEKVEDSSQKANYQEKLDSYDYNLHLERPVIGKSAYSLFNDYLRYKSAVDVPYLIRDIAQKDEAYRKKLIDALDRYAEYARKLGADYGKCPWNGFTSKNVTIQGKAEARESFTALVSQIRELLPVIGNLNKKYSLKISRESEIRLWIDFLRKVPSLKGLVPSILDEGSLDDTRVFSSGMMTLSIRLNDLNKTIDESFDQDFYELDGAGLCKQLKLYDGLFSRLFSKDYRQIKKSLKLCARNGFKINYRNACEYTQLLADFQKAEAEFNSLDAKAHKDLGLAYDGRKTAWKTLEEKLGSVPACFENKVACATVKSYSQELFDDACHEFGDIAQSLENFLVQAEPVYKKIESLFDGAIFDCRESSFEDVITKLTGCLDDFEHIEMWKFLQNVLAEIGELNAIDYLDCCIANEIPLDNMSDAYSKLFYTLWLDHVKNENDILGNFDRVAHSSAVSQFSESDSNDLVENRKKIKNHLLELKPSANCVIQGSGIGIINREAEKQKNIKPVRRLISEVGETIQAIKPCFLMSPLSVSTFIPAGTIQFDTVIFDEASQVFPQDAVGAIYRGKQIIVVGDSKQMPPTNFFSANLDVAEEDDYDDLTDYESILDLCSTSFRQLSLLWHYRSRFEQLIAFSNHNFYDGRLITFPSATIDCEGIGVDYYHVDGCFEHKSRYNVKEAERVVDLILEHAKKYPERSLGVVAFSVAQQDLIDQLLEKRINGDAKYDWLFDKSILEPFFIKNLESVQGDERDTIIFSTAYGKDSTGKLMHNFGPLNKQGGERRLNVAVSRARLNVQVVSSMHGTDIDVTKTSARGALLLKQYLDFAEKGPIALSSEISVSPKDDFDSPFEKEVCEFLRSQGFTVDIQVGCSGFKIDLGIRKPDSSEYFLAVECDGASYHSSKNARDRDRLRQAILERMGWNFYRVWSTDWLRHELMEKEALLEAVRYAEKNGPRKIAESTGTRKVVVNDIPEILEPLPIADETLSFPPFFFDKKANFRQHGINAFFENVRLLLESEIAVSKKALVRRIAEERYGQKRITARIENAFNAEIALCSQYGIEERNEFLFLKDQYAVPFRVPGDKRPVEEISLEELSNGMLTLAKLAFSIDKMSLFKTVNTLLGYDRLGPNILERFEAAIVLVLDQFNYDGEKITAKIVEEAYKL